MSQLGLCGGSTARVSPCGRYRYTLTRKLRGSGPEVLFGLANPSVADATKTDRTLGKCIGFAERLFDACAVLVVNPYAWRAQDPDDLRAAFRRGEDIVGPDNALAIQEMLALSPIVIVGWGNVLRGLPVAPVRAFAELLRTANLPPGQEQRALYCLGKSADGSPRHPLMLPYSTPLERWPA